MEWADYLEITKGNVTDYNFVKAKIFELCEKDFIYFSDPIIRWQFGNVQLEIDAAANIKPNKAKSSDKIDTIMAICMSVGEEMYSESPVISKYTRDNKGFFTI